MFFELVSDRECLIDGIGLIPANDPVMLDNDDLQLFKMMHGYPLTEAHFPNHIRVTAVVTEEGGDE